jgi:hypothetical protein
MLVYPTLNNQGGTKLSTISHNFHMGHYGPNSKLGRVWQLNAKQAAYMWKFS